VNETAPRDPVFLWPWSAGATVQHRLASGWLVAVVLWGAWLRWPGMAVGFSPDEIGTVMSGSAWAILTDPEAGVNPPLWRLITNVPWSDAQAPWVGRTLAFASSLAAIVLAGLVGFRAGGKRLVGLVFASTWVAAHPMAVTYASVHRIYSLWMATMLLHVLCLGLALDEGEARGRWGTLAWATAVLLPWIHYMSVPVLLGLGLSLVVGMPGRRRWVAGYGVAALGISPMIPYVLFEEGRRVLPQEPLRDVISKVVGVGGVPPKAVANLAAKTWAQFTDLPFHFPAWASMSMWILLAALGLAWPWLFRMQRLLVAGAWSVG